MEADERSEQHAAETEGPDPSVAPPPQDGADVSPDEELPAHSGDTEVLNEEPDYKDLYLRARAEAENVRKRARRDVEVAQARGVARLARELLPAMDNLDRAIAAAEAQEDEQHELTKGIRLVQKELLAAMARVGIEAYSPQGETFDPHHHEAIAQQPVEGAESGTIVTVYQSGYRYRDEVLRAAKVVVAA
ncbi:MAG TPA: nucleotide exchange factor GrpE [Baekduia sp.]|nr:nucleotide exchange factor GrpE [Baekduia sp.]